MGRVFILILICASLLLGGCLRDSDEKIRTIDLEGNVDIWQKVLLSEFAEDIIYIPLETYNDIYFYGIYNCLVNDSLIIVKDINKCILYDINGKYLATIGEEGRGPGEHQYVVNARFGPNGTILIQDLYDLLIYRNDGSFVEKRTNVFLIDNQDFDEWWIIRDTLIFGEMSIRLCNEPYMAVLYDIVSDSVINYYENYARLSKPDKIYSQFSGSAKTTSYEGKYLFKEVLNDTLFTINDDNKLSPIYVFKLGKYEEPLSNRLKMPQEAETYGYIFVTNFFKVGNNLFFLCAYNDMFPATRITPYTITVPSMDNKSVITVTRERNTSTALGIYNDNTGEIVMCEPTTTDNPLFSTGLLNDIDGGPRFLPVEKVNDSTLTMWIEVTDLKNHVASDDFKNAVVKYPEKKQKLQELADSLSEFDNPVIMMIKLK